MEEAMSNRETIRKNFVIRLTENCSQRSYETDKRGRERSRLRFGIFAWSILQF